MRLIDTHCHIDMIRHFPDWEMVISRARDAGVSDMILAGVYRQCWPRLLELSARFPFLHAAPGLHPMYLAMHRPEDLDLLDELAAGGTLVAVGEVGLDFHVDGVDHNEQLKLFEAQVDIAARAGLPMLLHIRKAHDRVLATLRRKRFSFGGIVHAYSGSHQQALQFIGLGFKIGICGTVTYDRARKIRRVAAELPLSSLVLETDSPDIPPVSHWGERNLPEYLPEILHHLTQLRSEEGEYIAQCTTENVQAVLKLSR